MLCKAHFGKCLESFMIVKLCFHACLPPACLGPLSGMSLPMPPWVVRLSSAALRYTLRYGPPYVSWRSQRADWRKVPILGGVCVCVCVSKQNTRGGLVHPMRSCTWTEIWKEGSEHIYREEFLPKRKRQHKEVASHTLFRYLLHLQRVCFPQ
jgi:hypothetical protein